MFTGIVEEMGRIRASERQGGVLRVRIAASVVTEDLKVGDSVSVSGCCLTAVSASPEAFETELTDESVRATAPRWHVGARVNLERAMPAHGRFGGHVVSGHVEGVGEVVGEERNEGATVLSIRAPEAMARWLVPKGSITADGVSMTVVDVGGPGGTRSDLGPNTFTLWVIPHTRAVTTLGEATPGAQVNLEADVMARYAARAAALAETGLEHVS